MSARWLAWLRPVPEVGLGVARQSMTPEKVKVARQLYDAQELTVEEIAKTIGVSRKTVYRHLADDAPARTPADGR